MHHILRMAPRDLDEMVDTGVNGLRTAKMKYEEKGSLRDSILFAPPRNLMHIRLISYHFDTFTDRYQMR